MAQVTSGLVSVEDGIKKPEEYAPPRKVRVELSFSVGEDEAFETIFDHVSEAASNRVASLLNGTVLRVAGGEPVPRETAPRRGRPPKVKLEDAPAAEQKPSGDELPDDPTGGEEHVIALPDESDGTGLEDDFTVQPEPETLAETEKTVTDADLNAAVQRKNAELNDPDLIRKLIAEYNPDPKMVFQLRQIEPAKRAEFLTKLGDLKKAG